MRRRRARASLACPTGLGLVAGAVLLAAPARAQAPPPDTTARADTVVRAPALSPRDTVPPDTIKAPLTRAEFPIVAEAGGTYRWNREELFVGGGLSVIELLERIPGVTSLRSQWISSPTYAPYLGDASRVRVFFDGIELPALDDRSGGLLDLADVPLWTLEELVVERGADELRVHLRSWRVDRIATVTRTDVLTGDEDTNLYRGFFGRRFDHGEALQLAGQQSSTTGRRTGGEELALLARLGWAARWGSVDAFALRARRTRDTEIRTDLANVLGARSRRTTAYARAGLGDPDRGAWLQLVAASLERRDERGFLAARTDSVDTVRVARQFVGAAGLTLGALRVSATGRVRSARSWKALSGIGRAGISRGPIALSAMVEVAPPDSVSREEIAIGLRPMSFLAISGAVSRSYRRGDTARLASRAEALVRIRDLWLGGGAIATDNRLIPPVPIYDSTFVGTEERATTGLVGIARGRLWRAIHVDAWAVRWKLPGAYRPQLQTRSDLYVRTRWLTKFPSGNFGFLFSARHDYRGFVLFPSDAGNQFVPDDHELSMLMEIRIVDAVLFWRQRLTIGQEPRENVPGSPMPRRTTIYGVRWDFWN